MKTKFKDEIIRKAFLLSKINAKIIFRYDSNANSNSNRWYWKEWLCLCEGVLRSQGKTGYCAYTARWDGKALFIINVETEINYSSTVGRWVCV